MAFYDEFNKYYDFIFPIGEPQLEFISKRLTGNKVLDIACGTGNYATAFAERGYDVSAVDLDEGMIKTLNEKAEIQGVKLKAIAGDMKQLQQYFSKESFQTIFCIGNSLVHLTNLVEIRQVLKDMYSLLDDEGRLILQIINYDRILKYNIDHLPTIENNEVGISLVRKYDYNPQEHLVYFNTELMVKDHLEDKNLIYHNSVALYPLQTIELKKLLDETGFEVEEQYGSFKEDPYSEKSYGNIVVAKKYDSKMKEGHTNA